MYAVLAPIVLALSLAAAPAQTSSAQKPPEKKAKKVWTNDDLDSLRAGPRGGGGSASAGASAAEEEKPAGKEKPVPREKDSKMYREKLAPLRAQLEQVDAQIKQVRDQLTNPVKGSNAVDLSHTSAIMRPEAALSQLEQKRREIQQKIDDLEEEARRNGVSPGDIR